MSLTLRMSSQSFHSQNPPTVRGGRDREPSLEETFYPLPSSVWLEEAFSPPWLWPETTLGHVEGERQNPPVRLIEQVEVL